jgi:hypothetical protein
MFSILPDSVESAFGIHQKYKTATAKVEVIILQQVLTNCQKLYAYTISGGTAAPGNVLKLEGSARNEHCS